MLGGTTAKLFSKPRQMLQLHIQVQSFRRHRITNALSRTENVTVLVDISTKIVSFCFKYAIAFKDVPDGTKHPQEQRLILGMSLNKFDSFQTYGTHRGTQLHTRDLHITQGRALNNIRRQVMTVRGQITDASPEVVFCRIWGMRGHYTINSQANPILVSIKACLSFNHKCVISVYG